jgi:hypothetical protein
VDDIGCEVVCEGLTGIWVGKVGLFVTGALPVGDTVVGAEVVCTNVGDSVGWVVGAWDDD